MTQIGFRPATLEQVVSRSDIVVVAEKTAPFVVLDTISILPEGSEFEGRNVPPYYEPPYHGAPEEPLTDKNYPPFVRRSYRFRVVDVLHASSDRDVRSGDTITVAEAYAEWKLGMHRGYYLHGKRKSPLFDRYATSMGALTDDWSRAVLFVNDRRGQYSMAVDRAYESVEKKQDILRLIDSLKSARPR